MPLVEATGGSKSRLMKRTAPTPFVRSSVVGDSRRGVSEITSLGLEILLPPSL
jgi:hypothetical protein